MKKELAESFSLSFHPIFVAFYSLIFVFVLPIFQIQSLGSQFIISVVIIAFISTVLLPIFSLFMLKRQRLISSIRIEKREERFIPYLLIFTYYSVTAYMIFNISYIPIIIPLMFAIPAVSALVLAGFNFILKVSAHALSMASVNAIIWLLMNYYDLDLFIPLIVTFLLSAIVIVSRHYLKDHSWFELFIGYILGFIITIAMGYIALYHPLNLFV